MDATIDRDVPRTKSRPIPSGRITRVGALISFTVLCAATATVTNLTLGRLALEVSLPIYAVAGVYPYTKRFLPWPQFVLAPAVAWPAFVGWVSVAGNTETIWDCVPLFLSVCIWTIYFDTCYGIQVYSLLPSPTPSSTNVPPRTQNSIKPLASVPLPSYSATASRSF